MSMYPRRPYKANQPDDYKADDLTMKKGRWSLWQETNGTSTLWHQCSKGKEEVQGLYILHNWDR